MLRRSTARLSPKLLVAWCSSTSGVEVGMRFMDATPVPLARFVYWAAD